MVWLLICAILLPTPVMTAAAHENSQNAHVLRRLNSPERMRTLEEAARQDAAAREEFAGSGNSTLSDKKAVASSAAEAAQAERPKTVTEVLFNGVAGFMGMPGLQSNQYDPYNPNADQGLGFHQDGTARRADGTTGTGAASAAFDGRRAASYVGHGLGYGSNGYGLGYGMGGYDPLTGDYDTTSAAYHARQSGGYGLFSMNDPQSYFMQRGLNYGVGWLNSMGEAAFTGLFDKGRARFNFMVDMDGRINGEGDVLYPFYDGQYTTVFTQVGARSMPGMSDDSKDGRGADRWIGNFGLGQRWYPAATVSSTGSEDDKSVDSGNWMIGYNAFFDYDFTRSHQRGGIGVEAQYDWLKVASNYYFPLSGWKGSYDFDDRFVEERPAKGWDVRVKAYLPFYRNLALTGAYSQWYGDHVGMFSSADLEKDPKVWSYGLEYTPIPLVSGFWNQRSTERGRSDTEFGIRFTYHFGMSWEDQTSHSKVADLRTVSASRHEFVDRENRIILEYKAKNAYRIEYLGPNGARGFLFRIRDGFGEYKAGQTVRVMASGNYLAEAAKTEPQSFFAQAVNFLDELISVKAAYAADLSKTYVTDGQGRFWIQLDPSAPVATTVTIQAGDNSQTFTLAGGGAASYAIALSAGTANPAAGGLSVMTATVTTNGVAASGQDVVFTWTVKGGSLSQQTGGTISTGSSGEAAWTLNGTGDRRTITVTATLQSDTSKTATADVTFGDALPDDFIALSSTELTWDAGVSYCAGQGGSLPAMGTYTYTGGTLPNGLYWSSDEGGVGAYVLLGDGSRLDNSGSEVDKSYPGRVVCVP